MLARSTNRVTRVRPTDVPSMLETVASCERSGSRLTRVSSFGRDPLYGHENFQRLRDRDFRVRYPDMQMIFQEVLHRSSHMFRCAIAYHIELTGSFSSLL